MIDTIFSNISRGVWMVAGLVFFGSQFLVYKHVSAITAPPEIIDPLEQATISGKYMENVKRLDRAYEAFARSKDINAPRTVQFSAYVPIRELLEPGEKPPTGGLQEVFASARAAAYAQKECAYIVKAFASECELERANGRHKDGYVDIDGTLRFIQREDRGAIDPAIPYAFTKAETSLERGKRSLPMTSTAAARSARAAFYRRAARECAEIKRREGTCAITKLYIRANFNRKKKQTTHYGKAEYGFLRPQ